MLLDLGESLDVPWTLVGGQMVLLHVLKHGQVAPQVSQDGDVVADIRRPRRSRAGSYRPGGSRLRARVDEHRRARPPLRPPSRTAAGRHRRPRAFPVIVHGVQDPLLPDFSVSHGTWSSLLSIPASCLTPAWVGTSGAEGSRESRGVVRARCLAPNHRAAAPLAPCRPLHGLGLPGASSPSTRWVSSRPTLASAP